MASEAKFCANCPSKWNYIGPVNPESIVISSSFVEPLKFTDWPYGSPTLPGRFQFVVEATDDCGGYMEAIDTVLSGCTTNPQEPFTTQQKHASEITESLERARPRFLDRINLCDGPSGSLCPARNNIAIMAAKIICPEVRYT